ncbi:MAG: 4Fe-4S binding protein [Geobacter sp.]|nr:4Fe-4S binding protein [Geobacter sp.]
MAEIVVNESRCSGCGRCVSACRERLYSLEVYDGKKFAVRHDSERCTRCLNCRRECLLGVIVSNGLLPDP